MSKTQGQLLTLVALGSILGATVFRGTLAPSPEAAPNGVRAAASGTDASTTGRTIPVTGLHMDLLSAKARELESPTRNPFRFLPRPAPPVQRVAVAPPRPVPVAPPVPTGPPPPPPIPLKFIGVLDAPARVGKLAILSDSRGGVFYGKEGDTIEGRYKVLKISTESADLAYMDGRGRQTIRLSGQ